jgi:hypothetical protein
MEAATWLRVFVDKHSGEVPYSSTLLLPIPKRSTWFDWMKAFFVMKSSS